ncbi:MAG: hypothetical protein R3B47_00010 [Bacteroidia bacterium]
MKFLRLLLLAISLLWFACGDDDSQHGSGGPDGQDSSLVDGQKPDEASVSSAESSGILGRWELVEKRIPTPISLSGTFFTFNSNGKLTISNPGDPDLEDLIIPFSYKDSSLSFDTDYQLIFVSGDSMVLESETDGIREVNILKRR